MADTGKTGAAATSEGTGAATATADAAKAAADAAAKATADKAAADTKAAADKVVADAAAKAAADKAGTGAEGKTAGSTDGSAESKAPEKYDLKVPDAGAAFVEDADLKFLEKVARENNWTNDEAQAALEEHLTTLQAQSDRFLTETKADKTYGGDKLEETQRLAKSIVDKIRPAGHARRDSFLRFMGRGGAGNHIEVLSFLADLGKAIGEDTTGHTRPAAKDGVSAADKLYDNPTSKVGA
jgi:hypothetical protein